LLVIAVMPPHAVYALPAAEDSLATARDLYTAAEYESALQLLNRLRDNPRPADQAKTIEQYRALCLLALGRAADAEQAIAAIVSAEPSFKPSEAEASPRVRSAFSDVRRRMWPSLVQQRYGAAKQEFDRKNFPVAASGFAQVLEMLADPDSGDVGSRPQLADIRTLATEFKELSIARTAPPTPAPLPASASLQVVAPVAAVAQPPAPSAAVAQPSSPSVDAPSAGPTAAAGPGTPSKVPATTKPAPALGQPPTSGAPPAAAAGAQKSILGPADADVSPPVPVRQVLPPVPPQIGAARPGVVEIVVDETGGVESATMRVSVNPYYDRLLLEAARGWKYRPATLKGEPVKYRKSVQIAVQR
jgi:TonB family protein